jgi:uncharacterized protein
MSHHPRSPRLVPSRPRLRWLTGALAGVLGFGACTEAPRELYAPIGAGTRNPALVGSNPGMGPTASNGDGSPGSSNGSPGSGATNGASVGNGNTSNGSGNGNPGNGNAGAGGSPAVTPGGGNGNLGSGSIIGDVLGSGGSGNTGSGGTGGASSSAGGTDNGSGNGSGVPAGSGGTGGGDVGNGGSGGSDNESPGGGEDPAPASGGSDPGSTPVDPGTTPGSGGTDPGGDEPPVDPGPCGLAPVSSAPFSREALRAAAAQCATWHYCRFDSAASTLDARVQELSTAPSLPTLEAAQAAWRAAMALWSRVELFQFGPLGSKAESAGKDIFEGQGIRDLIHAWPSTARCRVEDQLISQTYAARGVDAVLISGRGLFGLEYLLFYPNGDTACAANSATGTQWARLDGATIAVRKRAYAAALASDIAAKAKRLIEAWSPSGGNFMPVFVGAGGAYPGEQEVMNVLAWSLVYVEREVKDWKIGVPAGYTLTSPVTLPEAPFAGVATESLQGNLRGFRSLFQGCGDNGEGLGFDDWLNEVGHPELAADMLVAWERAQAAVDAFPPLHTASIAQLDALYSTLKGLTDLLKADFFGAGSPLNLELPGNVEGDTD